MCMNNLCILYFRYCDVWGAIGGQLSSRGRGLFSILFQINVFIQDLFPVLNILFPQTIKDLIWYKFSHKYQLYQCSDWLQLIMKMQTNYKWQSQLNQLLFFHIKLRKFTHSNVSHVADCVVYCTADHGVWPDDHPGDRYGRETIQRSTFQVRIWLLV